MSTRLSYNFVSAIARGQGLRLDAPEGSKEYAVTLPNEDWLHAGTLASCMTFLNGWRAAKVHADVQKLIDLAKAAAEYRKAEARGQLLQWLQDSGEALDDLILELGLATHEELEILPEDNHCESDGSPECLVHFGRFDFVEGMCDLSPDWKEPA